MENESNQAGRDQRLTNPKRKKAINFFFYLKDFEIIKDASEISGLSLAGFMRNSALEKARQIIQKNRGLSQNA